MKLNSINLHMFDQTGMCRLALCEASRTLFPERISNDFKDLLFSKNVIFSGEFFSQDGEILKENLRNSDAKMQSEITPETEILICGRYPDWTLVEEAKIYGIGIVFADKEVELFSRIAAKLCNNKSAITYENTLGF